MQQLIHHSPLGPIEIAGVVGRPEPGEPFDVDDDIAAVLLEQGDLYSPAPSTPLTVKELRSIAKDRDIDLSGLRRREEILAAIANHDTTAAPADTTTETSTNDPEPTVVIEGTDTTEEHDQ